MILFLDTETTGLPESYAAPATDTDNWPRLVSVAWQLFECRGELYAKECHTIKPDGFLIPEAASDIHGITTNLANLEGIQLSIALTKLRSAMAGVDRVVIHNEAFDRKVINAECHRLGLEEIIDEKQCLCTMKETTKFCQLPSQHGFRYSKLQELHVKTFERTFDGAHSANADVDALQRCYWELIRRGVLPDLKAKKRYALHDLPEEIDGVRIDPDNPEFQQALDIVLNTRENLYLTGKAGSGKTFFLKCLQHICKKSMVVVAPTGIAAVNAGGVTIHSKFLIGPPYVIPPDDNRLKIRGPGNHFETFLYNQNSIDIFRTLELLVIDEISMVRADILDLVDSILQIRRQNRGVPFGGVQLLMIGDAFQLPPITRPDEMAILNPYYEGYFFFNSRALSAVQPLSVELQKIYRQSDPVFIDVLNNTRVGTITAEQLAVINERFLPDVDGMDDDGYIEICTTNAQASHKNNLKFGQLDTDIHTFTGVVTGTFPDNSLPVPINVALREGAQVMFVKNDTQNKIYNGLIGTIVSIKAGDEPEIEVELPDGTSRVAGRATWTKYEYVIDEASGRIKAEPVGSYSQIPFKLAWAITVHKSQGMTFKKMIATVAGAWDPGQVYVALSRCTSLEGLVLREQIPMHAISAHPAVTAFAEQVDYTTTNELLKDRINAQDLYYRAWKAALSYDLETAIRLVKEANSLDSYTMHPRYKRATRLIQQRIFRNGNSLDRSSAIQLELTARGEDISILNAEIEKNNKSLDQHKNQIMSLTKGQEELEAQFAQKQADLTVAKEEVDELQQKLIALKKQSFWARLFRR